MRKTASKETRGGLDMWFLLVHLVFLPELVSYEAFLRDAECWLENSFRKAGNYGNNVGAPCSKGKCVSH